MDEYARAPAAMLTAKAAEAVIDLTKELHDAMEATYTATRTCRRCGAPFGEWDTLHPLYRSWSTKCPDCHTRDIQLDFAHQNTEA